MLTNSWSEKLTLKIHFLMYILTSSLQTWVVVVMGMGNAFIKKYPQCGARTNGGSASLTD
jgi:hypothetical protein